MSFSSIASMLEAAKSADKPLYTIICEDDCQENNYTEEASHRQIQTLCEAMQQSSKQYCASDRSNSGFIGGDAEKLRLAAQAGALIGGTYLLRVIEEALKVAECNACMKRIVAAPTAGSCGVLPAVLLPLTEEKQLDTEVILQALYIAAGFGQVKRNVVGAVNAVSAANMALAGITSHIPADEVIDTMGEVGDTLPASLRETGLGGLAATPTGKKITEQVLHHEQLL